MAMRMIRGAPLVLLVVVALAACTTSPSGPSVPGSDAIERSKTSSAAPAAVQHLAARASCGEFVLDQGEHLPADAVTCMADAENVHRAQLIFTTPTTEGDPIVQFVFADAGRQGFAVATDSGADRYGSGGWNESECASVEACGLDR